ncbi:hypothetical protein I3V23_04135 [Rhodobacterales bacterium HKCCA1288]|nr:hypothetical protein I3V23_04135 [Rhodobacterales bacterium HKCCA1288]
MDDIGLRYFCSKSGQRQRFEQSTTWCFDNNFVWRAKHNIATLKEEATKNINARNAPPSGKSYN